MSSRISELLEEIRAREEELESLMRDREAKILYHFEGGKVRFEAAIREAHRKLKVGVLHWLRESEPRNILSAPVIYSMIVPFVLLDLTLTLYQWLCFPLYRIARVKRSRYIIMDRQHLVYLNSIQKLNCMYCGYGNGLLAYAREIVSRTEQYWCPIKHVGKVLDPHRRYARFAEYGVAVDYPEHSRIMRQQLREHPDD